MAWIELHTELVEHRKIKHLMRETDAPRDACVGRLCMLWLWAIRNRPDGDLSDVDDLDFQRIWELGPKKTAAFRRALESAGLLDRDGDRLVIHDWDEYAGRLLEARKRDRERKREARRKDRKSASCPADSDGTSADSPPLPYQTVPYQTKPNQSLSDVDEGGGACAGVCAGAGERAEMDEYLQTKGLKADSWFGATPELLARSRELTEELFRVFCTGRPTEADYARVFPLATRREDLPNREIRLHWDADRASLLRYAFEQANFRGQSGKWDFVEGVLRRLGQRGIRNAWDAERYDLDREDGA